MLKIAPDLTSYALSAGEPFLMQVQLLSAAGAALDIADQSIVLSFYKPSSREVVEQIEGLRDVDGTGEFFRFEEDGTFSEELYGSFLRVELARRYAHGRAILGDGSLSIAASAATVPSLDGAAIGEVTTRVTIRAAAQLGGVPLISLVPHAYEPAGVTIPLPSFSVAPSITSDGTPSVGEQLAGNDGTIADGSVSARVWLLAGAPISGATGATFTPTQAGDYQYRVTAAGDGGTATATSAVVTVAAAPVVAPAPAFTAQPSISPGSGTAGQTFTATDGTASNATSITRRWLLGGTAIGTGATVTPNAAGSLVLENTATGAGGATTTTSAAVTVAAAPSNAVTYSNDNVTYSGSAVTYG